MRAYTFIATLLLASPVAAQVRVPTPPQLVQAWGDANTNCRGSTDPESPVTQEECSRRERLAGRLGQAGWCFGIKGERQNEKRWHRCTPQSNFDDDLVPDR